MKNLKFKEFYKVATLLAIVLIFSSSCKKDDKVNPDSVNYVGSWIAMDSITTDYGDIARKDIITFTATTLNDLIQILIPIPVNNWIDLASLKGSISVNGNTMNVTVTEVGKSSTNMLGIPTGTITSYKEGTTEFNKLLSDAGQSKTFKSEFSISGNKLTLKTDINKDGDYLDDNETTVYTKQ